MWPGQCSLKVYSHRHPPGPVAEVTEQREPRGVWLTLPAVQEPPTAAGGAPYRHHRALSSAWRELAHPSVAHSTRRQAERTCGRGHLPSSRYSWSKS